MTINTLHHGNALDLDSILESDVLIDTTITSPPYWNQKDYGDEGQIGFGQSREDFLKDLSSILTSCLRATKSTGSLWIVVDDFWKGGVLQLLPWEIARCAEEAGWIPRDLIIWDKGHDLPFTRTGQTRHVSEMIFFFSKSQDFKYYSDRVRSLDGLSKWWVDFPERFNPKGKALTNVWSIPVRTQGNWRKPSGLKHECPFPTELVTRILELSTDKDDLVFDPFAGSGMVLATAEAMGRRFFGVEINQKNVEMYKNHVRNQVSEEYKDIEDFKHKHIKSNADFESDILKLRALKFTRQALRPLSSQLDTEKLKKVKAAVCTANIPSPYRQGLRTNVHICIIADIEQSLCESILAEMRELISRPPLSSYGIDANISIVNDAKTSKQMKTIKHDGYYLYMTQKPRSYIEAKPMSEWIMSIDVDPNFNGPKIAMLSNLCVDVSWVLR